ncbi:PKD domain-containing protein [Leucobacter sp. USHLN153]|uniref:PKD domain-containing protein n=1 Tax=Leucobacter sp. USHLN153 TaxID=3081268 RepID=UPI00301A8970
MTHEDQKEAHNAQATAQQREQVPRQKVRRRRRRGTERAPGHNRRPRAPLAALALAAAAILASAGAVAVQTVAAVPADAVLHDTTRLYVGSLGTPGLTVVNPTTDTVTGTIALPAVTPSVVASPDGAKLYARTTENGDVYVVDTATGQLVETLVTSAGWLHAPSGIAISRDGALLALPGGQPYGVQPPGDYNCSVWLVETATGVERQLTWPSGAPRSCWAWGAAFSPDGSRLYVSDHAGNRFFEVDATTGALLRTLSEATNPHQIENNPTAVTVSPDGTRVFLSFDNPRSIQLASVVQIASDRANLEVVGRYTSQTVSGALFGVAGLALSPDGARVYGGAGVSQYAAVIDATTTNQASAVPTGAGYQGLSDASITPDGSTVYFSAAALGQGAPLTVYDSATGAVRGTVPLPGVALAGGIAMTPAQAPTAAIEAPAATLGSPVTFDASASTGSGGVAIVSYDWSFGDGTTQTTDTPTVEHTYGETGAFDVQVTVTDELGVSTTVLHDGTQVLRNGGPTATATTTVDVQPAPATEHTVTFDPNGGTGTMDPQTASDPTALTPNAFTRDDFTFDGWNTAADGSGTAYADGEEFAFDADAVLYAQWTESGNGDSDADPGPPPPGGNGEDPEPPSTGANGPTPPPATTGTHQRTGAKGGGWLTTTGSSFSWPVAGAAAVVLIGAGVAGMTLARRKRRGDQTR